MSLHKQFMNGRLHTSSSCSGSGLPRVVEHYIGQKMKVKISHVFACEKEPWKQRWNHKVVGKFSGDNEAQHAPCMHPDIWGLCGTSAHAWSMMVSVTFANHECTLQVSVAKTCPKCTRTEVALAGIALQTKLEHQEIR